MFVFRRYAISSAAFAIMAVVLYSRNINTLGAISCGISAAIGIAEAVKIWRNS